MQSICHLPCENQSACFLSSLFIRDLAYSIFLLTVLDEQNASHVTFMFLGQETLLENTEGGNALHGTASSLSYLCHMDVFGDDLCTGLRC